MSGNFVMRGEPALYNKFVRARAAVDSGVDLVIELPVPYALSSAEYFAMGAVSLLDSLGGVDFLSFGSETGDIDALYEIAKILNDTQTVEQIKTLGKKGMPVFSCYESILKEEYRETIKAPNNILGINYIKALLKLDSSIKACTVKREKTDYNDRIARDNFASATAIRELLKNKEDIKSYIPETAFELIKDYEPVLEENINESLVYALRMKEKEEFLKYADTGEGLHNLIKKASDKFSSIEQIVMGIKSKRYSYTRIKRILYNIYLDIPKELREQKPNYARVLAFSKKGQEIMAYLKEKSSIPIITNLKKEMLDSFPMLNYDLKAGKIYSLLSKGYEERIIL